MKCDMCQCNTEEKYPQCVARCPMDAINFRGGIRIL